MYAVIVTGGKQYKVTEGEILNVEKLDNQPGDKLKFEPIMCAKDDKAVIGTPTVEGASVSAEVLGSGRDKKIMIFKYKAKKNVRKRQGHRQSYTQIKITKIKF